MSGEAVSVPRVLVVRSDALRDRVGAAMAGARLAVQVDASPSYLSAMGWLTHEHADVIIGEVSAMTGMVGSTARALRRLAPGTRLIIVAEPSQKVEAEVALSAGFDHCVYEPADATTLLNAMRLAYPQDGAQVGGSPAIAAGDAVRADQASRNQDEPVPAGATAAELAAGAYKRGDAFDRIFDIADNPPPESSGEELGDTDLAEAVMRNDGSLLPMALRMIHERAGLGEIHYDPPGEAAEDDAGAAELVYVGRSYGRIRAPHAEQGGSGLASWASWLARWVALDSRQSDLYDMAMRDELTGLWNRRYFDRFLRGVLEHATHGRQQVTLLVFDIDNFKTYNDNFGHPAGDEILQSTASLIQSLVREHDVVARIGGDEFAVIFWDKGEPRHLGSQHPDNVLGIAKRFQKAICEHRFPKLGQDAVGRLTVSGGLAGFPWDGRTPAELLARADAMALKSKRQGKNAICFGPGAAPNGNGKH